MKPVIELEGVCLRRGRNEVLRQLDLKVESGEVTVLLGRNGVGKSSLLHLLLGQLRARSGEVRVLGLDPIAEPDALLARLAFVPDHPDVDPRMTPRDLLRYLAPFHARFDLEEAQRLLERFEVPLRRRFSSLSRGQATKALLASALATDPELLLLDELFAGLDPVSNDEVLEALISEARLGHRALLLTTHDLEVASRIADRIVILRDGRIHEASDELWTSEGAGEGEIPSPSKLRDLLALVGEETGGLR